MVNISWKRTDYSNFILDPLFYLEQELTMVREGDLRAGVYPIGCLGNENRSVLLQFLHSARFEDAKAQWDRRKKRINADNLFVKMGFETSEEKKNEFIAAFEKVPYKKILFYNGDEEIAEGFKTERFLWSQSKKKCVQYNKYNDFVRSNYYLGVDLLKLLTGELDWLRER